jgi:dodecin
MAKKGDDGVYKIVEVVGTSRKSWEDAASRAVTTAAKSLRDLRIAEITKLDMKVENGRPTAYRARVSLSLKASAKVPALALSSKPQTRGQRRTAR